MTQIRSVEGSVVFVTGASGGLGQQWVTQFLERGAVKIYAAGRTQRDWNDERVVPVHLDVTDEESIVDAMRVAGDTTVLVNNAGATLWEPISTVEPDLLRRAFDVNFFGPVALARHMAPVLKVNGGGAVIDVLSVLSWLAKSAGYSAAKAAMWSATNSLRIELLEQRTHVLGLFMGYVDTPMTASLDVPKISAQEVVAVTLDGLEQGAYEVLADAVSAKVRAALGQPLEALYPELAKQ
ncbi:short-subunit dehydrogenase [Antricoccus suffuscus]|uniref:Short-subunit dehydrogenase n=1 Tax=Antricoccus suffuscus TaxID=1629062 RepID=A0A2T1A6S8_9ACTN|nr:SDR family oxidoreductase [Antricoccus suffuscus]PRZ44315.1 short-subunit dehydrogenase [Antricoccus suffuscus]